MTAGKYKLILHNGAKVNAEFIPTNPGHGIIGVMKYKILGNEMTTTIYADARRNKLIFEKA